MASSVVENFHGVYLLYCKNPKYIGRTYIGYTVDPNRRIQQHNKGAHAGGARRTSKRGPWYTIKTFLNPNALLTYLKKNNKLYNRSFKAENYDFRTMVMIIHGFPNDIAALRFEWAWQHPTFSRRLKHVPRKKSREKVFDYCLRLLSEMLRVGPWNRLPLTIRWLDDTFKRSFPLEKLPPVHMPIVEGTVISKKLPKGSKGCKTTKTSRNLHENQDIEECEDDIDICNLCYEIITKNKLTCINYDCNLKAHLICLSKVFLKPGECIPVDGQCPKCMENFLWGDLVRKLKGCFQNEIFTIKTTQIDEELSGSDYECTQE